MTQYIPIYQKLIVVWTDPRLSSESSSSRAVHSSRGSSARTRRAALPTETRRCDLDQFGSDSKSATVNLAALGPEPNGHRSGPGRGRFDLVGPLIESNASNCVPKKEAERFDGRGEEEMEPEGREGTGPEAGAKKGRGATIPPVPVRGAFVPRLARRAPAASSARAPFARRPPIDFAPRVLGPLPRRGRGRVERRDPFVNLPLDPALLAPPSTPGLLPGGRPRLFFAGLAPFRGPPPVASSAASSLSASAEALVLLSSSAPSSLSSPRPSRGKHLVAVRRRAKERVK